MRHLYPAAERSRAVVVCFAQPCLPAQPWIGGGLLDLMVTAMAGSVVDC